ncbi:TPA: reverse transcriptase domain-containing protein [Legionella pneumophila]
MQVTYLRFQDDVIVLCETERQLKRCKERLMKVLKERKLRLSRKKTRISRIDRGGIF